MLRPRLHAAVVALVALAAACAAPKKPARSTEEDDNAKAFAELEKNDRDDSSAAKAKPKDGAGAEEKKGPVYPAPFTAEQLRDATKNGRTYRYKVELPNKPAHEYAVTFRKVDENGAEVHQGDASKRMGWLALQQAAEFPKDKTTTHKEKLKTPAGKFECTVYEVDEGDGEIWTFFFAKKLPGAPVFFYVERNGKRLRTTTLVEYVPGR